MSLINEYSHGCLIVFYECRYQPLTDHIFLFLFSLSLSRVPAAYKVVFGAAAGGQTLFRGHIQPLLDADHRLVGRPGHSSSRQDCDRNQAAQHQPRAHCLLSSRCNCGPMTGSVLTGLVWLSPVWLGRTRSGLPWHTSDYYIDVFI